MKHLLIAIMTVACLAITAQAKEKKAAPKAEHTCHKADEDHSPHKHGEAGCTCEKREHAGHTDYKHGEHWHMAHGDHFDECTAKN
ncbi:MAG: hypothetical protein EB078_02270 [Proteobacteria bacterium]|nr:hypothetical protein [Pseudomonadota bacterium]NDC23526.1 hypothetical protein [Pseudomonadota bacterium]NDD03707.1 hypothetical protein [Pseudomonadota bacterium]NDG26203.1 hypothetical protein [Pseudomonadota bacterium]